MRLVFKDVALCDGQCDGEISIVTDGITAYATGERDAETVERVGPIVTVWCPNRRSRGPWEECDGKTSFDLSGQTNHGPGWTKATEEDMRLVGAVRIERYDA